MKTFVGVEAFRFSPARISRIWAFNPLRIGRIWIPPVHIIFITLLYVFYGLIRAFHFF